MASYFEKKNRHVIPNWRSLYNTISNNELEYASHNETNRKNKVLSIDDYLGSWDENKSISNAGDLLSAAFVNSLLKHSSVVEAANFVLNNESQATSLLIDLAKKIINPSLLAYQNGKINN